MTAEMLTLRESHVKRWLHPWRTRPRPKGVVPSQVLIHSTRGKCAPHLQARSTINWLTTDKRPPNGSLGQKGQWGSACAFVVGQYNLTWPKDDKASVKIIQMLPDPFTHHPSWSAGYGGRGPGREWGADETSYSIEVGQSTDLEPYTDEQYAAILDILDYLDAEHDRRGWPRVKRVRVEHWAQARSERVPPGIISHDAIANGLKLGKTDPGPLFDYRLLTGPAQAVTVLPEPTIAAFPTHELDQRINVLKRELGEYRRRIDDLEAFRDAIRQA